MNVLVVPRTLSMEGVAKRVKPSPFAASCSPLLDEYMRNVHLDAYIHAFDHAQEDGMLQKRDFVNLTACLNMAEMLAYFGLQTSSLYLILQAKKVVTDILYRYGSGKDMIATMCEVYSLRDAFRVLELQLHKARMMHFTAAIQGIRHIGEIHCMTDTNG